MTQITYTDFLTVIGLAERCTRLDLPDIITGYTDELHQMKLRQERARFGRYALNHVSIYPPNGYNTTLDALYRKTGRGKLPERLAANLPVSAMTAKGAFYMTWSEWDEISTEDNPDLEGFLVLDELLTTNEGYRGLETTDFLLFTAPEAMKVRDCNNFDYPRGISIGTDGALGSRWTLHCLQGWPR